MVTSQNYTILRNLAFDFMNDATILTPNPYIGTEWMFGPDFLVAPISQSGTGTNSRQVYLPGGSATTWYDFWAGNQYTGSTITASASITSMPLYIRAGSILPLGPNIQYAGQKQPDTIALRIYRGANGKFTLYEDEGDNYNYETGTYATIPITYRDASPTVTIGARSGSFPGMLATRTFKIVWVRSGHGIGLDSSITIAPTDSDRYVTYTGAALSIPLVGAVTGVLHGAAPRTMPELNMSFKTAESIIVFPQGFAGRMKSVEIYNLNGMLLKRIVTSAESINLRKSLGKSIGVTVVKARTVQ
jgi:alpha-D-xyloside xylohydrolase